MSRLIDARAMMPGQSQIMPRGSTRSFRGQEEARSKNRWSREIRMTMKGGLIGQRRRGIRRITQESDRRLVREKRVRVIKSQCQNMLMLHSSIISKINPKKTRWLLINCLSRLKENLRQMHRKRQKITPKSLVQFTRLS